MQTGLGTVYAWSVYRRPLSDAFGWSITEVTLTFSLLILTAGFAAFLGGVWLRRSGPRRVAVCAGVLYGAGVVLASLSADRLPLLYLTYGLMAGAGFGLGYIVPIATLVKWFPDRRGFITGLAVSGVAAGSLIASPIAAELIESIGVLDTLAVLGAVYLVVIVGAALLLRDPPAGYRPAGWTPPTGGEAPAASPAGGGAPAASPAGGGAGERQAFHLRGALRTSEWYLLWAIFFLNVTRASASSPRARRWRASWWASARWRRPGSWAPPSSATRWAASPGRGCRTGSGGAPCWPRSSSSRRASSSPDACRVVRRIRVARRARALLLRRELGHHGGDDRRLVRFAARGVDLRVDAHCLGFGGVLGPLVIAALRESSGGYTSSLRIIAGIMVASVVLPLVIRRPAGGA